MCGIAGVLVSPNQSIPISSRVEAMGHSLKHRGPDSSGTWLDTNTGIGLAHRRLSIVDLSDLGSQPIKSHDDRLIMVFNGEIYNHLELRQALEREGANVTWRGHSDSETLVECLARWGNEKTLKALVGMFAFALWDRKRNTLSLARDRIGEKPLYYGLSNGLFAFSSELRGIRMLEEFELTIDPASVASFLRFGYVPDPESIYEQVFKVPPGTWIEVTRDSVASGTLPQPIVYWSLAEIAQTGRDNPASFATPKVAIDELEALITQSVTGQLMGDVPIGAFLSGGIDSSTIASIMQKESPKPIKTFSIGFEDSDYDEMPFAAEVARRLGTDHHELAVSSADATEIIPHIPDIYDEPFADSSQIPTYLVSKLAKQEVQVSLSGDGGDELFAGYTRYFTAGKNWGRISKIPVPIRRAMSKGMAAVTPSQWNRILGAISPVVPTSLRHSLPGDKMHKIARVLSKETSHDLYLGMVTELEDPQLIPARNQSPRQELGSWPIESDLIHQMMAQDSVTYLPGDILVKVDRATMANSLESRVPFLDHRIVEFAWKLPLELKLRNNQSKWILREVLKKHIPEKLFDRPKMGFGIPLGAWLRGPLREWAEGLLSPAKIGEFGYLEQEYVSGLWSDHLSGRRNFQHGLWNILMLQAWLESEHQRTAPCE